MLYLKATHDVTLGLDGWGSPFEPKHVNEKLLGRVTYESEALETLLSVDRPEAVRNALVETRVSL